MITWNWRTWGKPDSCNRIVEFLLGRDLQFSSVQLLSRVWLFVTLWTAAHQASLSITNCLRLPKPISIELVMPSNHFIFCHALLLLPSIFPSLKVFFSESAHRIRWPKYWSINSFNDFEDWFPLGLTSLIFLTSKWLSRVFSSTTIWKHQFFGAQPSLWWTQRQGHIQYFMGHINSLALSLLYVPTLTSIQDCWKNHNLSQQSDVSVF